MSDVYSMAASQQRALDDMKWTAIETKEKEDKKRSHS
jgi:hypothetical protein